MPKCYTCRAALSDDKNVITCSMCDFSFHGTVCSGMTEEAFVTKRDAKKVKLAGQPVGRLTRRLQICWEIPTLNS